MRVAIVWNQCATFSIRAGKFDNIGVDMLHRCNDGLAFDLDDRLMWGDGCGSDFWLDPACWLNVPACHVQFDSVRIIRVILFAYW